MFWTLMTYAAWGISALIIIWMLVDAIRVSMEYDEDLLTSSREGVDYLDQNENK